MNYIVIALALLILGRLAYRSGSGRRWNVGDEFFRAYGQGAQARAAGDGVTNNPYPYGTFEYDSWVNGWSRTP